MKPPILLPWEDGPAQIVCGFFGREGGVSIGPFRSLNLSYKVGDASAAVDENWRRAAGIIGKSRVVMVRQVHGTNVYRVTRGSADSRPQGDGMVTSQRGIVLGILSADCVPVLMVDAEAHVVGALHAGWRGTIAGIARAGLGAMVEAGAQPSRIRVALGPSIGWCCFEVDADLGRRFAQEIEHAARHVRPGRPGKAYIDLRGIISDQLRAGDVEADAIINAGPCTRCAADRYFSRRAGGGAISGLQLSFVGLES